MSIFTFFFFLLSSSFIKHKLLIFAISGIATHETNLNFMSLFGDVCLYFC